MFFTSAVSAWEKLALSALATFTATTGIHHNVKVKTCRFRASTVPALCLALCERAKGIRSCKENSPRPGAGRNASEDDCRKRKRHNGSRSQPVEWNQLHARKTRHTALH